MNLFFILSGIVKTNIFVVEEYEQFSYEFILVIPTHEGF